MRKILKYSVLFLISTFFIHSILRANFIGMNWGARPMALGNAYVALADDPSAVFWNPAGLANIGEYSLIASHQNLWGVKDLYNEMVSVTIPLPRVITGAGWSQINLLHEYSEQVINISCASIVWLKKIPFKFGMGINNYLANVKGYKDISEPSTDILGIELPGKFDLNAGFIINPRDNLSFGFVVRNLIERTFTFISEDDKISHNFTFGIHYLWRKSVNFVTDYNWQKDEDSWHFGGEIWFFNVFAPRVGMNGENLTIGFGIKTKEWKLDGAVLAHEELGSTYRLSFCLQFK